MAGVPASVRPRPPVAGAGDLRRDPVPERGGEGGLGQCPAAGADARPAAGRHRADARAAIPRLPPGDLVRRPRHRRLAVAAGGAHAGRRAGPRRGEQPADAGGARRRYRAALHAGLRLRRHAGGLRRGDGRAHPVGRAGDGRHGADPRLRRHRHRRHRQRARRLPGGAAGRADRDAGAFPDARPAAPFHGGVAGAADRGGAGVDAGLHRHGADPGGTAARAVPGAGGLMARLLPVLVFGLLAAAPFLGLGESWAMTLLARGMILAIAALSLWLPVGGAGLVSLGHAAMLGIGAYAVVVLDDARVTEALVVAPVAIAAAAAFALATGAVAIRTAGVQFIMITLAFGQMAFFTAASLSAYGGDDGYTLYGRSTVAGARWMQDRLGFHYLCLGLLVAVFLGIRMLLASRFGRVLRAARGNPLRVEAGGVSPHPSPPGALPHARGHPGPPGVLLADGPRI